MKYNIICRNLLIGALCMVGLSACDITEFPYNSITEDELESNPSSVEAATLGSYAYMKERLFHTAIHFNGEFGSDNVLYSGQSTSANFYIYNFQRNYSGGVLLSFPEFVPSNNCQVILFPYRGTSFYNS